MTDTVPQSRPLPRGFGVFQNEIFHYTRHMVLAALCGIAAGLGGILFHYLLETIGLFFDPEHFTRILSLDKIFIAVIPVIGALIAATMRRLWPDIAARQGVLSVIKAVIVDYGYIPLKNTLFHLAAPIICIGTGAPLGPEGPAAKIGSGIGSFMSQAFRLNRNDMMMYTAAGAGAAISAVFNAPIAGVFFGIEVILLNDLKNRALSVLIIASVTADLLSRNMLSEAGIFTPPRFDTGGAAHFPFYLVLGAACGLTAAGYLWLKKQSDCLFHSMGIGVFARLLPVAALFGLTLLFYGHLFGIGYKTVNAVLHGQFPAHDLAAMLFLKILFLALFLSAGGFGGTFAPSLGIGALAGALFATLLNRAAGIELNVTAFALAGMGGVLAGIHSIPLTAIMLVFEITRDYSFILPLMLVSVVAYLAAVWYNGGTIYEVELLQEGIDVTKRGELDLLSKIRSRRIMRTDCDTVSHRAGFKEMAEKITGSKYGALCVTDDSGALLGVISLNKIKQVLADTELVDILIAADLCEKSETVNEETPVSAALSIIENGNADIIPVMKSGDPARIAGIITHEDIILAYTTLLRQAETGRELVERGVGRG